jgi:hypothetical protein
MVIETVVAAVREEVLVALIGFLGRSKARELAHGPHLAAIAAGVNAARVRRLTGVVQILVIAPVGGQIGLRVQAADRHARDGTEAGIAMFVEVDPG